jgi:hypothetical protein
MRTVSGNILEKRSRDMEAISERRCGGIVIRVEFHEVGR